jgi:myosin protein heavy chain
VRKRAFLTFCCFVLLLRPLQFLTQASGRAQNIATLSASGQKSVVGARSTVAHSNGSLEEQLVTANIVIESFGNSKTMHNNNSSRFGKMLQVKFVQASGVISGGHIQTLLLEKSRVTDNGGHERNFHIFYNLLKGLKASDNLEKFKLSGFNQENFSIIAGEHKEGATTSGTEGPRDLAVGTHLAHELRLV